MDDSLYELMPELVSMHRKRYGKGWYEQYLGFATEEDQQEAYRGMIQTIRELGHTDESVILFLLTAAIYMRVLEFQCMTSMEADDRDFARMPKLALKRASRLVWRHCFLPFGRWRGRSQRFRLPRHYRRIALTAAKSA